MVKRHEQTEPRVDWTLEGGYEVYGPCVTCGASRRVRTTQDATGTLVEIVCAADPDHAC